jgi:hypothetical protein
LFAEVLQCPRRFVFGRRIARLIALRGVRSVLALVGVTLLLSACASVPSQEMSDARRALDEAIAVRVLAGRSEEIRHSVASARAQGRAWQDMDQLMQRAIAMSRNGDIKGALSLSEKAIGMLR